MHLEDNKIDKVQWGEEEGVGIRLIKEGKTYYGYTTEITYENLLEIAKTLARGQGHGPVAIGKRYIKGWTLTLIDPDEMSLSYRAELLHRANQKARSYGDKIKQVLAVLMDKTRDIMVINSLGERAEDLQKRVVFFVEVVASDGSTLQRGYESVGGNAPFEPLNARVGDHHRVIGG